MDDEVVLEAVAGRVRTGRPRDWNNRGELPAPVSARQLADAEALVGHAFPPLLTGIYRTIANGGVGPGGGIEGLPGGHTTQPPGMIPMYLGYLTAELPPEVPPPPPPGVLFIADWGCAIHSLLDCRKPDGRIWSWNEGDRVPLDLTFRQWLEAWLDGVTVEPTMLRDLAVESPETWSNRG